MYINLNYRQDKHTKMNSPNRRTNWPTYEELQRDQQRENEENDILLNQATNWSLLNIVEERAETGVGDLFDRIDREEEQHMQEIQDMILRVQDDEEENYGEDVIGDAFLDELIFNDFLHELMQYGICKENIPPNTNIMIEEETKFYISEI